MFRAIHTLKGSPGSSGSTPCRRLRMTWNPPCPRCATGARPYDADAGRHPVQGARPRRGDDRRLHGRPGGSRCRRRLDVEGFLGAPGCTAAGAAAARKQRPRRGRASKGTRGSAGRPGCGGRPRQPPGLPHRTPEPQHLRTGRPLAPAASDVSCPHRGTEPRSVPALVPGESAAGAPGHRSSAWSPHPRCCAIRPSPFVYTVTISQRGRSGRAVLPRSPSTRSPMPLVRLQQLRRRPKPRRRAAAEPLRRGTKRRRSSSKARAPDEVVRVSVQKLDTLLNLVGELVIHNSGFVATTQQLREQFGKTQFIYDLEEKTEALSAITRDLQDGIMKARMLPDRQRLQPLPPRRAGPGQGQRQGGHPRRVRRGDGDRQEGDRPHRRAAGAPRAQRGGSRAGADRGQRVAAGKSRGGHHPPGRLPGRGPHLHRGLR